jgi:hypothetical protein
LAASIPRLATIVRVQSALNASLMAASGARGTSVRFFFTVLCETVVYAQIHPYGIVVMLPQ